MTTFYVTCGTSATSESRCWNEFAQIPNADEALTRREVTDNRANLAQLFAAEDARRENLQGDYQALKACVETHRGRITDCWENKPHLLPAEVATVQKLFKECKLTDGDPIRLLAGEGNVIDGWVVLLILQIVLPGADIGFFDCDDPAAFNGHGDWTPDQRFLDRLQQLDGIFNDPSASAYVVTGGYKALLLFVARKLFSSANVSTRLYYLFEGGGLVTQRLEAGGHLEMELTV